MVDGHDHREEAISSLTLRTILDRIREKYKLPALAAAILTSRRILAVEAVGYRKWGSPALVTVNDQFHLGSNTKAMTATLLATLVEEGKLGWYTSLEAIFPDLIEKWNPAYREITLEQLLTHRAGLSSRSWPRGETFFSMHKLAGLPHQARMTYVDRILRETPVHVPRNQFLYSNRSYVVAAAIAEKIENKSWEDLMRNRIFDRLQMSSAGFGAMGVAAKVNQLWQHKTWWRWHHPIEPGRWAGNPPAIAPAGDVHCSISDWAKFVQQHLAGERGESGLLTAETFKYLHTLPPGSEYAFGWAVVNRSWAGGFALTHSGSNTMNFAVCWLAQLTDFAVLVMTNQGGGKTFQACDETARRLITVAKRPSAS